MTSPAGPRKPAPRRPRRSSTPSGTPPTGGHLQARDLEHGLDLGNRSVDILARVQSARAKDYVREFTGALAPWRAGSRPSATPSTAPAPN
jgi:hypothetical protein